MNLFKPILFTVILTLVLLSGNHGQGIEDPFESEIRLIETQGEDIRSAEAVFLVPASPELCFQLVTDYETYPEFMPLVRNVRLMEMVDSSQVCEFKIRISFIKLDYRIRLTSLVQDDTYSVSWDYVSGDLKNTTGSWLIQPDASRPDYSLIHYRVLVDVGQLIPGWVSERLSLQSLPEMIEAVRARALLLREE